MSALDVKAWLERFNSAASLSAVSELKRDVDGELRSGATITPAQASVLADAAYRATRRLA